jgi:hypothetical protein
MRRSRRGLPTAGEICQFKIMDTVQSYPYMHIPCEARRAQSASSVSCIFNPKAFFSILGHSSCLTRRIVFTALLRSRKLAVRCGDYIILRSRVSSQFSPCVYGYEIGAALIFRKMIRAACVCVTSSFNVSLVLLPPKKTERMYILDQAFF